MDQIRAIQLDSQICSIVTYRPIDGEFVAGMPHMTIKPHAHAFTATRQ